MIKYLYIFLSLCFVFSFGYRLLNKQKKKIIIGYALNNEYANYLYTSLVSLFENSDRNTIYQISIQIGRGFSQNNKDLILSLEKYYFNCFIQFIQMNDGEFGGAIIGYLDISVYYRLKLPILLGNINRIIYIDSDTLIFKDLTELYTLNFYEKYILGRLDMITDELDKLGTFTKTYINDGIILMDLYNLRKYNYYQKFIDYIKKNKNVNYLNHHDQTCINYVCHKKIGILRLKYHMWPFLNEEEVKQFNNILRIPYNENE